MPFRICKKLSDISVKLLGYAHRGRIPCVFSAACQKKKIPMQKCCCGFMVENNPQQDLHSLGRILFCGPAAENATTCEPTLIEVKVTK